MNLNRTGSIINFNYSYLDMENVKADFPLLYRPNHKIRFTVLQKTPGIDFTLSTKYTSTQLYEDFLSDDHPIENNKVIFPLETLPATFITDFSMSKTLLDYDLTIRIKNLFNRQYVLIQHYPMPGRNFEISINKVIK